MIDNEPTHATAAKKPVSSIAAVHRCLWEQNAASGVPSHDDLATSKAIFFYDSSSIIASES
jgi:hypothetical protein